MSFFRNAACWLGLVDQGWVRVKGPGVDVVITGDRAKVHQLLVVVQDELIRIMRESDRSPAAPPSEASSAVVPAEFDERDSPYVVAGRVLHARPRPRSAPRLARPAAGFAGGRRAPRRLSDADTQQVHHAVLLEITEQ